MFLNYNQPLFRPPSEAYSLILQVMYGCSHNKCNFCYMYKSKKFKIRSQEEVLQEIKKVSSYYKNIEKIFLADGDALVLPTKYLLEIFNAIKKYFPHCKKISLYANPENILKKSKEELQQLAENGLSMAYLGIESGNNEILKKVNKGATAKNLITAIKKARQCKIKVSTTVILGLGGKKLSVQHSQDTAKLINESCPDYLSCLVLMLGPFEKYFAEDMNNFKFLNNTETLQEMGLMLKDINPTTEIIFCSNHASNYLPLKGTLPYDKEKILQQIDYGLKHPEILIEEEWRGL